MTRFGPLVMTLIGAIWTVTGLFSDGMDQQAAFGIASVWLVGAWIVNAIDRSRS